MYASCSAEIRSYSSRVMVCLVALVESSTTKVDLVLRESTLALTTTLSNSVTWLLGIFSVNCRSRSGVGFHSTNAALTSYTTTAPPRWRLRFASTGCGDTERSAAGLALRAGQTWPGHAGSIWGVYPGRLRSNILPIRHPPTRPVPLAFRRRQSDSRASGCSARRFYEQLLRGVAGQDDLGPSARTCSTCARAVRRSDSQES